MKTRIGVVFASMLCSSAAQAEGPLSLVFPAVIEPPLIAGGKNLKPGDAVYQQLVRSAKAIRTADAFVATYRPRVLDRGGLSGDDVRIPIPAGTVLVLARNSQGDMYCTTGSEGRDSWLTFYDTGFCARDLDGDGTLDEQIVIEPFAFRARIAYELLGTGSGTWKSVKLPYTQLPSAEIPPITLSITLDRPAKPGLLSLRKQPEAYLSCGMAWPRAMVLSTADDSPGKYAASFEIGNYLCDSIKGMPIPVGGDTKVEVQSPPFAFKLTYDADLSGNVEMTSAIAPGPALLMTSGRYGMRGNYKFQVTIMRLVPQNSTEPNIALPQP